MLWLGLLMDPLPRFITDVNDGEIARHKSNLGKSKIVCLKRLQVSYRTVTRAELLTSGCSALFYDLAKHFKFLKYIISEQ